MSNHRTRTGNLDVAGARLYYETRGSGPVLVMIPGASGTADGFRMVADQLAARYTVVGYDRRGFSRSHLDGPQDYDRRLDTDADDVRSLIEHLAGEPATVFGASSGAIVALAVLTRHPSAVGPVVAFEPPAVRLLADGQQWIDFFAAVYDLYRRSGTAPALGRFRGEAFVESDRLAMARAMDLNNSDQAAANARYWFEHELRQYPAAGLDLDALTGHAGQIVLAAGRDSRGYPCHDVATELGTRLGRRVTELPGGHVGCMTHAAAFAAELLQTLPRPADTDRRPAG